MKKILFIFCSIVFYSKFSIAKSCGSMNNDPLFQEILNELKNTISASECLNSKVHLTFDDGPSDKTTGPILDALNKRNIKATFFISTTNLETGKKNLSDKENLIKKQIQSGHLLASHGHEHDSYDLRITASTKESGFSNSEREKQITESLRLLNQASKGQFSKQDYKLFRFPYGRGAMPSQKEIEEMEKTKKMIFKGETYAEKLSEYRRQSPALMQLAEYGFSHLGWNHDSNDSSLPASMPSDDVIKKYVFSNIQSLCKSKKDIKIALFHDIKEVNVRSIPLITDLGVCMGIHFLTPKETMASHAKLANDGVLVSHKKSLNAPVETVDEIGKLLRDLNKPKKSCPEIKSVVHTNANSCYSEYLKKTFSNCEGQSSICYNGKWYSHEDPFIILNCSY